METKLNFRIQNLLSKKDGHISGAMSPMLFAKEMAQSIGVKYNRLARIYCEDERINQHYEDSGLTGNDTLIIGTIYSNDVWLSLWVDTGTGGMPVAMAFRSDNSIDYTKVYKKERYAKELSEEDIKNIFSSIFSDPTQLDINED